MAKVYPSVRVQGLIMAKVPSRRSFLARSSKRQRKSDRRNTRHHLVQTLENRAAPGSMWDVLAVNLARLTLGDPDGDPLISAAIDSEAARRQEADHVARSARRSSDNATNEGGSRSRVSTGAHQDAGILSPEQFRQRSGSDRHASMTQGSVNALSDPFPLAALSQQDLAAQQLDASIAKQSGIGDPQEVSADASTQPTRSAGGGGGAVGSSGNLKAPLSSPASAQGQAVSMSRPTSPGGGGGGTATAEASGENADAATTIGTSSTSVDSPAEADDPATQATATVPESTAEKEEKATPVSSEITVTANDPPPEQEASTDEAGANIHRVSENQFTIESDAGKRIAELDGGSHSLDNVQWQTSATTTSDGLGTPLGQLAFDVTDVEIGGSATVHLTLPEGATPDGYVKVDPATGESFDFSYDGQTGAIIDGNQVTLHFIDGGRGDADGIANGVIADPGAATFPPLLIGPGSPDPLDDWTTSQFGGGSSGEGTVTADSDDLVLTEGNSFLVEARHTITTPETPSVLQFHYEGQFDTTDDDFINDAFEVALIGPNGWSVVPTIGRERDAFFNVTEELSEAVGSATTHETTSTSGPRAGIVRLDISSLPANTSYDLVLRLVNDDEDDTTWVRLKPPVGELTVDPLAQDEGSAAPLLAVLPGINDISGYTAAVDWGDGSPVESANLAIVDGDLHVTAEHVYADDQPEDYEVDVTVSQSSSEVDSVQTVASIANVAPTIDPIDDIAVNVEDQASGDEREISFATDFADVGLLDTHTYEIDWGDGSTSAGSLVTTSGGGTVDGTHTYAENGTYDVTVTVTDDDGGVAEEFFKAYISGDVIAITEDSFVELDLSGLEVEAGYNNELGMFITQDADGTIRDDDGTLLAPGDAGYAEAAITHSSRRIILHQDFMAETKNMAGPSRQQHNYRMMVEEGSFVSFYAIQNQTTEWWLANNPSNTIDPSDYKRVAFFTARDANPDDAHPHFKVSTLPDGSIRYGHEDLLRGQYNVPNQDSDEDYDDLNFTIRVTPISQSQDAKFFVDNDAASNDEIFFYNAEGNSVQTSLNPTGANDESIGLTSNHDGSRLWSIDQDKAIYEYDYNAAVHTLSLDSSWTPKTELGAALNEPTDIATDSEDIWVVDHDGSNSRIYIYDDAATSPPSVDQDATSSFALNAQNTDPSGLAVDATRAFVTDLSGREVFVYDRAAGTYLGRWDLDPGNQNPTDVTTEPTGLGTFSDHLYVVDKTRGEVFYYPDSVDWVDNGNDADATFLSKNSTWNYLVTGSEPAEQSGTGASWKDLAYDDSAWPSGQAPLGYGTSQTTTIGYGGDSSDKNDTTYFRTNFSVSGDDYTGLDLNLRRDDGAVVYINGVEVARHNMNFGEVDYDTQSRGNNGDTSTYHNIQISPTELQVGSNVIAIEVHKWATSGGASDELIVDAELESYVSPFRIAATTFSLQVMKQVNGDTVSLNTFPEGIADPPTDPGDTIATANTDALSLTPNVTTTLTESIGNGSHSNKDVDFYSVSLAAGQSLTVDIDTPSSSLDSYLRLFDDNGTQLDANDDESGYGSTDSLISYTPQASGDFHVGVSGSPNASYDPTVAGSGATGSTGSYSLDLTAGDPPTADVPGDDLTNAKSLTLSHLAAVSAYETIGDGLHGSKDVDLFEFSLAAGQSVTVDINTSYYGSLDSYVRLFDDAGTEVDSNDDDAYGSDSLLTYTAPSGGTYFASVSGAPNDSYDPGDGGSGSAASTGDYTAVFSVTEVMTPDVPGDELTDAQSIALSVSSPVSVSETIGDGLHGSKDVDLFAFSLQTGQSVTVDIDTPGGSLDSYVRLFDDTGTEVASNNDEDGYGTDSLVTYTAPTGGTFYAGVSGNPNGSYDPQSGGSGSAASTGDYTANFSVDETPPDLVGDMMDTATRLLPRQGTTIDFSSVIGDGGRGGADVDMFSLVGYHGQELTFEATTPTSGLDSYLRLFDSSGIELASNDDQSPSDSDAEITYVVPSTGQFYIAVSSDPNSAYDPQVFDSGTTGATVGAYTLEVTADASGVDFLPDALIDAFPITLESQTLSVLSSTIGDNTTLSYLSRDVDMVAVDLVAGQRVFADVEPTDSSLESYVRLFDDGGNELDAAAETGGYGDIQGTAKINFVVPTTGTYTIGVSSAANQDYNPAAEGSGTNTSGPTGAYLLRLGATDPPAPAEIAVFADSSATLPLDATSAAVSFGTTAASTPIRRTLFVRNEGTVDFTGLP